MPEGRIPRLRPDELDDARRRVYDSFLASPRRAEIPVPIVDDDGRLLGPYNYFLIDAVVGPAARGLARAVSTEAGLPGRLREVTVLAVARAVRSEVEWWAHARIGREVGLTDDEIAAILAGEDAPSFADDERVARRVVAALVVERVLGDELYAEAQDVLGEVTFYRVVMLAAFYAGHALLLTAYREPLPEGTPTVFD